MAVDSDVVKRNAPDLLHIYDHGVTVVQIVAHAERRSQNTMTRQVTDPPLRSANRWRTAKYVIDQAMHAAYLAPQSDEG